MVWFLKLGRCWFSLVFALGRRQIHPQTPYISRVSTTSPESNHTSPEQGNPSGDAKYLEWVIYGSPVLIMHCFLSGPYNTRTTPNKCFQMWLIIIIQIMGLRLKGLCFPRPLAVIIIEYNWTCPPSGRNLLSSILMSLAVDVGGNAGFLISAGWHLLAVCNGSVTCPIVRNTSFSPEVFRAVLCTSASLQSTFYHSGD